MCVLFSASSEVIRSVVMSGQRPGIQAVRGPEHLEEFARNCIMKCWEQEPQLRPTSGGETPALVFIVYSMATEWESIWSVENRAFLTTISVDIAVVR